jgi:hypothetical protein
MLVLGLMAPAIETDPQGASKVPKPKSQVRKAAPATTAAPSTPAALPYKSGGSYQAGHAIALDDAGHHLLIQSGASESAGGLDLRWGVSGDLEFLGFTYGKENSTFVLLVEGIAYPAVQVKTTQDASATGGGGLFTRMVTDSPKGTLVLDTNQFVRILRFQIRPEHLDKTKVLRVQELSLGKDRYSLTVELRP